MKFDELMEQSNHNPSVIIFGENHFKFDEVSRIRRNVIDFQPDIIVHELYWEEEYFYRSHLPNIDVVPLEKEVGKFGSLKSQFISRERSMISRLKRYYRKYNRIAVVIGDAHLRTVDTKELGKRSPVITWANSVGAKVVRSNHREIN